MHVNDKANGFRGTFVQGIARASWTMTEQGFSFTTDAAQTSREVFAAAGYERNGVFDSRR